MKAAGEEFREQLEAASRLGGHHAAWALGGIEAAAGVVRRESYPVAQGGGT